jgi:eukaryotic-like serine/threonine-protein kinase
MAMRKSPDRRYATADALADDVRRHMRGAPVIARHGERRYRLAKFLQRNWLPATIVASLVFGLALVAGLTLWQNKRLETSQANMALERDRAKQVSEFMVDVFSQADPYTAQGREVTAKELLDRGAAKITADLVQHSEVRAELLESIGLAYRRQGLSERAIPMLEQALAIHRGQNPKNNLVLITSIANLALALKDTGGYVSAEAYLKEALTLSRKSGAEDSLQAAEILRQLGHLELSSKSDLTLPLGIS